MFSSKLRISNCVQNYRIVLFVKQISCPTANSFHLLVLIRHGLSSEKPRKTTTIDICFNSGIGASNGPYVRNLVFPRYSETHSSRNDKHE